VNKEFGLGPVFFFPEQSKPISNKLDYPPEGSPGADRG
jgi:hypothetical protein